MKVLALVCQKGGTAKTTAAINLAVEALAYGVEAVIIDLDPQVSACDWKDIRGEAAPVVAAAPVPHHPEGGTPPTQDHCGRAGQGRGRRRGRGL